MLCAAFSYICFPLTKRFIRRNTNDAFVCILDLFQLDSAPSDGCLSESDVQNTANSLPKALQHENDSEDEWLPSQNLNLGSQCIVGNVVEAEDHFCCIFFPQNIFTRLSSLNFCSQLSHFVTFCLGIDAEMDSMSLSSSSTPFPQSWHTTKEFHTPPQPTWTTSMPPNLSRMQTNRTPVSLKADSKPQQLEQHLPVYGFSLIFLFSPSTWSYTHSSIGFRN